jgi:hypothetical protein
VHLRNRELHKQPHLTATPLDVLLASLVYKQRTNLCGKCSGLHGFSQPLASSYHMRKPTRVQAAPKNGGFLIMRCSAIMSGAQQMF